MASNLVTIKTIHQRMRWDFASYDPNYEEALRLIRASHWPVCYLGELTEFFKYGASIPAVYVEKGTLFIRAQNIREHGIDLSDIRYIDKSSDELKRFRVHAGDILITRSGVNVGEAAVVPNELEGSAHGSYSIRLRLRPSNVSPDYIAIAINSLLVRAQITALKSRSAQPNINIAELSSLQILLPPTEVQDRITSIMRAGYAERQEKLTQAERLFKGIEAFVLGKLGIDVAALHRPRVVVKLISQVSGNRFDFDSIIADTNMEFGSIRARPLKEFVTPINHRVLPTEEFPNDYVNYISLANISSQTGTLVDFAPVKGSEILSSSIKFRKGDILFGRMRPYLNKVWVAEFDGICTGEAVVLRPNPFRVNIAFLQALLMSRITLSQVLPYQSGTSLPRVSASHILNVKLPIPDNIEEQEQISDEITHRFSEATRLRAEAEQVVKEAKAKINRMIAGEGYG